MFKGRHFDRSVILSCVHGCRACGLSLRDPQEIMAERGIGIDHSPIHRWAIHVASRTGALQAGGEIADWSKGAAPRYRKGTETGLQILATAGRYLPF